MVKSSQFNTKFKCEYGVIEQLTPMVRRVVAPNPGPFTFKGTGTYIIGQGNVAVIDPGPELPEHVEAILMGLDGEKITHQLITHTHLDHSPAAKLLKERTGAPTYGFGPHGSGRFERGVKVEEGGDQEFVPDIEVRHGDLIEGLNWSFECVHTPGHTSNHICYVLREEEALFPGDHVMGWSTTVISPPDGDMRAYIDSLRLLTSRDEKIYYPTHGAPIENPLSFVRSLVTHRKMRERQIMTLLEKGDTTIPNMVQDMYKGLDPRLITAAQRSVFAHVIDLSERDMIHCKGELAINNTYSIN
jgi:glyoxylase-like metal-dependent hydrolase (beta-lactamase superfamily II)